MINELFVFIKNSPTAFHTVDYLNTRFQFKNFIQLDEREKWDIKPGGNYYVKRNESSVIAFKVGSNVGSAPAFRVTASHSDSPNFKIKENAEIVVRDKYTKLNTEGYGGMICSTWLDRPLSIAGRVILKNCPENIDYIEACHEDDFGKDKFYTYLVDIDRDLVLIPNLAIHMNRKVNEGFEYNKQVDMLPLIAGKACEKGMLKELIAKEFHINPDDIYGMDLYLYNRSEPSIWGMDNEFISSPQLDDLECAFTSLEGFFNSDNSNIISVYACFDNEEVGSLTKQGAQSTFLSDVLSRISMSMGSSKEDYYRSLAKSFMLSCDNAHAVHPNHEEKTDGNNCVYMNEGVVIKSHAGQKYTSDAVSIAMFKSICEKAGVPVQFFANRSDMAGGSTLGNIAMSQASMNCIDIGLAQLAMHSSYETAGAKDIEYMIKAITEFYNY